MSAAGLKAGMFYLKTVLHSIGLCSLVIALCGKKDQLSLLLTCHRKLSLVVEWIFLKLRLACWKLTLAVEY